MSVLLCHNGCCKDHDHNYRWRYQDDSRWLECVHCGGQQCENCGGDTATCDCDES